MLTQEELKRYLSYDPETGDFTWIISAKMAGKKAGTAHNKGYISIGIGEKRYLAHRLAWLYVYGRMPAGDIDHINGVRSDTRIKNLRECSRPQNFWNVGIRQTNTSGFKGVSWASREGIWRADIGVDGKTKYLGYFATAELASAAYQAKAKELHGKFYREPN